jgi:alkylation response protein AidB-like acyl-CoA dehydrogenase
VERWRLHGQKWFCSNVNADYFLVTARPAGAPEGGEGVGLFLVPAYREGRDLRNGYTVDRLKEKLGTRELATAEVTFEGARAWQVGPLRRGLPNLVRHVLVPSRFACVISAAGFLRRAERIVDAYTDFRTAFGRSIGDFPLVRDAVEEVREARREGLAAVFGLLDLWEESRAARPDGAGEGAGGSGGSDAGEGRPGGPGAAAPEAAVDFRVMLSLAKPVLTRRSTRLLHEAMMLLGGNGIEEEFSPLPRLHRDAVIMETWEGPHNVLLTQALRDLRRFEVDPAAFVERMAGDRDARAPAPLGARRRGDAPAGEGAALADELGGLLEAADDPRTTVPFARWAEGMVRAFARNVLQETP